MSNNELPMSKDPMFEPTAENMHKTWQELQALYDGMMELTKVNKEIIQMINNQTKWNEALIKKLSGQSQKDKIILP